MANEPIENADAAEGGKKGKLFSLKKLAILGGVVVVQGVLFFVAFKLGGGGPQAVHGAGNPVIEDPAASQPVGGAEVSLLRSFKVPNDKTGVLRIYDVDLAVVVPEDQKDHMKALVQERNAEVSDRVAHIIRGATDRMLREEDLRILKAQLLKALQETTRGEIEIRSVLVPRFVPIRAE